MSEVATNNGFGLDPENIARVYRGEPALVGEREVQDVLTPRVFEIASCAAEGLTYQEIADRVDRALPTIRTQLHTAYTEMNVSEKYSLVAYFPPAWDDALLEGKRLVNLEGVTATARLEILESLSTGMHHKAIAHERGIKTSTVRTHIHHIGNIWTDARGSVRTLRAANGLRSRYVRAIESATGTMEPEDIVHLTLPRLVELEPAIRKRYAV